MTLTVKPVHGGDRTGGFLMVVFEDTGPKQLKLEKVNAAIAPKATERIAQLEKDLKYSQEHLRTTIEELETTNEELKSSNEELQSTNEELQSTNEELETSQEELQSLNEELVTVNSELQGKIEDVTRGNDDMKNLLDSTKIATIFLDNELRVKRFTAEATKIINLIQADVGRPVSDIVSSLEGNTLARDAQQVIESLVTKEAPVKAKNGRWYLSRIIPYRTVENMIDGVVMTFTDITDQEIAQSMIQDARNLAEGMVETVREPLVALDGNFEVMAANAAFCSLFGTSPEVTVGQNFFDLGNGQWNIPKLRELLENVLPHNRRIDNFTVDHDFPTIGHKQIAVNAVRIHREGIGTEAILLGFEDITAERKER